MLLVLHRHFGLVWFCFISSAILVIMKHKNKFFSVLHLSAAILLLALHAPASLAQTRQISGNVTGPDSEPVIGASVFVSGTTTGTSTDSEGNFSLSLPQSAKELTISCIGYMDKSISLSSSSRYSIMLNIDTQLLDEVIFVGYGTMKKKDLTGSLSSLDGSSITKRQTTEITNALQGQMSGLTVTRSNSAPGSTATLRVRGITSMQESSPLIIIDGVPGSLSDVAPGDIQNLTVLKDAASAAIYGSRAAAGVVLVTTKRAKADEKVKVGFNYSLALDFPTAMPEYTDSKGYMEAMNELAYNDNPSAGIESVWAREYIDNYTFLHLSNPDLYPDTDWTGLILRKCAPRQNFALNVTGGTSKLRSKLSLVYDNVDGLYTSKTYTYDKYTVRVNNDFEINKYISLSADVNMRMAQTGKPHFSPASWMRNAAPIYPAIWSDGRPASGKDGANPYAKMMLGGTDDEQSLVGSGKLQLDIRPISGLVISGVFAPKYSEVKTKKFNKAVSYTPYDNPDGMEQFMNSANTTDLYEKRASTFSYTLQAFANYNKTWGKHHFGAMAGIEEYYNKYENIYASKSNYTTDYYPYLSAGPNDTVVADNDTPYENAYFSAYGRITYNWDSRYYIQANLRSDASGRFAKAYRWGFFPSVSLGWVISREGFMKSQNVVSLLKLRASYGNLGNERIGNYPYQSTMSFVNPAVFNGSTVVSAQGATNSKLAIENITWETTTTYDLGLDLNFLSDRLTISADGYYKNTKDMLIKLDIPTFMGYSAPDQNAGDMHTWGWDLDLGWEDNIGDFSYGINFNISDYKSVMGNIGDKLQISGGKIIASGLEYQAWYGYLSDGIFQTTEEVNAAAALTSASVCAGDIRYVDISGASGVPDGIINTTYDRTVIGSSLPRMNFGGNVYLAWKGLDFSLSFQGVGRRDALLNDVMVQPIYSYWGNVQNFVAASHWSPFNTINENKKAKYPRYSQTSGTSGQNYAVSDFWIIDGSYFRLKDVTVGYTLPQKFTKKFGTETLRFSISLSDFLTVSHFPKGWDPEVSSTGYPITKGVVFSANLKF